MKKKELTSLRSKSLEELKKSLAEKMAEVSLFFSSLKAGKEKNSSKGKNLRREIAQILTIIKEKEIIEKASSEAKKKIKK
jgi:ribosomal protein L29